MALCQHPTDVCHLSLVVYFHRDEDMDGEWEAPQIANPKCESAPGCGVWQRPMIDNPNYKGKWKPPMIDNPNYQVCASNGRIALLGLCVPARRFDHKLLACVQATE